ncbi:MAG: hypothetical protein GY795_31300 [Desulfobacterales bacterium]|nr:hypothetical protein [Desulfobacterales bacterium]
MRRSCYPPVTSTAVNIRITLTTGGFIDAFYNEQTGTTAFTLINQERRIFGADNTLQINLPLSTIIYYYLMDSEGADLVKTTLVWS